MPRRRGLPLVATRTPVPKRAGQWYVPAGDRTRIEAKVFGACQWFDSVDEADDWQADERRKRKEEKETGRKRRVVVKGARFNDVFPLYMENHPTGNVGTVANIERTWRLQIQPTFGPDLVTSMSAQRFAAWERDLYKAPFGFEPGTVKVKGDIFRAFLNWCVAHEPPYLGANPVPASAGRDLSHIQSVTKFLTPDEIELWWQTMRPSFRVAIEIGEGLGVRYGEAIALKPSDIDRRRMQVKVERQIQGNGQSWRETKPKGWPRNRAAERSVPIDQELLDAIEQHVAVFGASRQGYILHQDHEPLFQSKWQPEMEKVRNVAFGGSRDWPHFHALRDYYVSCLAAANIGMEQVRVFIGHAPGSPVTERKYLHLWHDSEQRARDAVAAARSQRRRTRLRRVPLSGTDA
jgi:integrase